MISPQAIEAARWHAEWDPSKAPIQSARARMVARALLDANDTIETYWRNWGRAVDNEMRLAKEKAEWKSKAERAEAALAALRQAVCRAETIIISSVASIREDGEDYYSGERALEILHEMTAQHMGETE